MKGEGTPPGEVGKQKRGRGFEPRPLSHILLVIY